MNISFKYYFILILSAALNLILISSIIYSKLVNNNLQNSENKILTQVNKVTQNAVTNEWKSCSSDKDCAYIPHPCCPGWTADSLNLSLTKGKTINSSDCQPKPAICISAQPVVARNKIIKPVCRKDKCTIEIINNDLKKPIQMVIPCKETGDCPGPAGVCGKNGYCIEGNR